jgi:ribose-phosphate pyrophosphokinase
MDSALAIVDKRRVEMDVTEVMHVIGDVHNRTCLILDDIIDTAGTLVKTCQALLDAGARQVYACATHAVLSGPAIERIAKSQLVECVVTNTIPLTEAGKAEPKIKQLKIGGLIGRAIQSIHEETSVSKLFL